MFLSNSKWFVPHVGSAVLKELIYHPTMYGKLMRKPKIIQFTKNKKKAPNIAVVFKCPQ